jgi:hypothetical protein
VEQARGVFDCETATLTQVGGCRMGGVADEKASPAIPVFVGAPINDVVLMNGAFRCAGDQLRDRVSPPAEYIEQPTLFRLDSKTLRSVDRRPPIGSLMPQRSDSYAAPSAPPFGQMPRPDARRQDSDTSKAGVSRLARR